ncbi:hypothetical protein FB45DRAFT_880045 [Roridomyces roridus]|uniref:Uncharacterized protein n=1 Tax=Roridomyces roridus TaxID=1738132 RepID=A0AAD7F8T3_9AGAR|nr:hypothetical protein FB45DRAFT_880045 [Roridomyces roridus]
MLDATLALMLVINVALLAIAPGAPQRHEPPIWIVHLNVNIRSRDNLKHSFKVQFDDEPTAVDASSTSSPDVPLRLTAVNHKIDLHDEDIQLPLAKRRPVRAAAQRRATSSRLNMQLNPVISSVFLHAGNSRVFVIPAYNQVPGLVRHNYNIEARRYKTKLKLNQVQLIGQNTSPIQPTQPISEHKLCCQPTITKFKSQSKPNPTKSKVQPKQSNNNKITQITRTESKGERFRQ